MSISYSDSFQHGFDSFINFIPHLIGALIILLIGWIVAKVLARVVTGALRKIRFDRALHTSSAGNYVSRVLESPSHFVGRVTYWLVFLAFLSFAASSLNLTLLNDILNGIYSYIPKVIAAILIFLVAGLVSVEVTRFVQRVMGRTATARVIGALVPGITMSLAVFMILNELGIAKDIVNILFTAIVGALSIAFALAFGLGGRDVARDLLEQAMTSARANSDQVRADVSRARANTTREVNAAKARARQQPDLE